MLALLLMGLLISALDVRKVLAQSPVPVISGPALSNQATIDVTIDFGDSSRAILGSEIGNPAKVEIVGGTVSSKVSQNSPQDTVWLVTIDRSGGNSDVNVTVHSGWYQDEAGNWNLGASKVFIYDDSAPDIGITNLDISKTVVGQGNTMNIKVTIFNYGNNTEHSNVTIYASTTVIHTYENIPLISRNSTTITFTWNTTGFAKGNYTIGAHAEPVEGETDFDDNNCTDGWVVVTWLGDLTDKDHLTPPDGVPDGKVDENDLWYFCGAFIDYYKIPKRLDANCDFDNNYKIDEDDPWTFCDAFIDYYKAQQH
jgi:hypothetical protein